MGLSPIERDSHKLTLEAYDRLIEKYRMRKETYKNMKKFLLLMVKQCEQAGLSGMASQIAMFLNNVDEY